MARSGLIFGAVSLILIFGTTLISPICAPCLGIFLGLAAGYVAGVFAKPPTSGESVRIGGFAGLIAGGLGLVGELIGGAINASTYNAAAMQEVYKILGIPTTSMTPAEVLTYQLGGAACIGIFNVVWMAALGIAGGALWYQVVGKKQPLTVLPPQEPIPPSQ